MTADPTPSLHHLRAPRRAALLWLLLVALFARGLVAPGFMPQFGAGGVSIVLCTPQGPKTLWKADEAPGTGHAQQAEQCAFGLALGMAAVVAAAPSLDLATVAVAAVSQPLPAASQWRERGTSARGPPSYS